MEPIKITPEVSIDEIGDYIYMTVPNVDDESTLIGLSVKEIQAIVDRLREQGINIR